MEKKELTIVDILLADMPSPQVVSRIDTALEENAKLRAELLELRKWAVRRHGEGAPAALEAAALEIGAVTTAQIEDQRGTKFTVAELTQHYRTDQQSPLHSLRFKTRENYDNLMRRIERDLGSEPIASLNEERLLRAYDGWSLGGKRLSIAHSIVTMLRILATYGVTELKNRDCRELKLTLHDMRFDRPAPRESEGLTPEQVRAIIAKANEMGMHSIALAQAFQFDFGLRQKDVIGEWVPTSDPGDSDVIDNDAKLKWLLGIRWEEINKDSSYITSRLGRENT